MKVSNTQRDSFRDEDSGDHENGAGAWEERKLARLMIICDAKRDHKNINKNKSERPKFKHENTAGTQVTANEFEFVP